MLVASLPPDEEARLAALREYRILDTTSEPLYDDIVLLAANACATPIALISLVDEYRQWFKARLGVEVSETSREIAFCAHAIMHKEPFVVEDAQLDERFADNPLVVNNPNIRFYAGSPLIAPSGHALGTLCVIDRQPRQLNPDQRRVMQALARQVVALMEQRRVSHQLATALEQVKTLQGMLPICAWCKGVRNDTGYWQQIETYLLEHSNLRVSHGICPTCTAKCFAEMP